MKDAQSIEEFARRTIVVIEYEVARKKYAKDGLTIDHDECDFGFGSGR